jgi:hypothetical protein
MMNGTLEVGDVQVACPVDDMKTTDCSRFFLGFFFFRSEGINDLGEGRTGVETSRVRIRGICRERSVM